MSANSENIAVGKSGGQHFKLAIVGSGPGGMSAAGRAAQLGLSHVLLEGSSQLSNTIFMYQKGKYVMDEPGVLPLRSPYEFVASSREEILDGWDRVTEELKVNVRFKSEIISIKGEKPNFTLDIKGGETVTAEYVILGIGLQGNLRKLGVAGEDLPFAQYQLDDPEEYEDETIVVVGAGDAAIENAVALAKQNNVIIVNRKGEFSRAKDGNLNAIMRAIESGQIECYYNTTVNKVDAISESSDDNAAGILELNTEDGIASIRVHRIIARLGAIPPRRFVESCGIDFPSDDPAAVPAISDSYESNVKGLHIVGALGGNPLIKAAMNQGYEVIEHIEGNPVEPADEPLLQEIFKELGGQRSVSETLELFKTSIPFLSSLTTLQLRELMLDSEVHLPKPDDVIFERNDYSNTFFSIVKGNVKVLGDADDTEKGFVLGAGEFFGERGLISGRRRSNTVIAGNDCVIIETKRRTMKKLLASVKAAEDTVDRVFIMRAIQSYLAPGVAKQTLQPYADAATVKRYRTGDVLLAEGEQGDAFHLIRSGSATISRKVAGRDVIIAYLPVGSYVGEVEVLSDGPSETTVEATVATETICIQKDMFISMMDNIPEVRRRIEMSVQERLREDVRFLNQPETGDVISFMMQQGLGEATDVLLIDESLCVHCDNCEKACADTHSGTSRLNREAGPSFATVHIPTSCRHCEHPHCMKDCPPDAIHRAMNGEVYIDDSCIGCGNCEQNCPYGVIQMASLSDKKPGLMSWLMFGKGSAPGVSMTEKVKDPSQTKKAVKCDMCKDMDGGPACVRACPTGAALRMSPEEIVEMID